MREITLELTDPDGETHLIRLREDGVLSIKWQERDSYTTWYLWASERQAWNRRPYAPLVPIIDTAFAALKEEA